MLTELGYEVSTKAHGRTATPQLKREVGPETIWEPVNAITQATESSRTQFGRCPYPVRLILTRQQRGDTVRYSTLVVSPPDAAWGQTPTLARYQLGAAESVRFYNSPCHFNFHCHCLPDCPFSSQSEKPDLIAHSLR